MVDLLEKELGLEGRSIVVLDQALGSVNQKALALKTGQKKIHDLGFRWTCSSVFDHQNGRKVIRNGRGNCPECGRPLLKTRG